MLFSQPAPQSPPGPSNLDADAAQSETGPVVVPYAGRKAPPTTPLRLIAVSMDHSGGSIRFWEPYVVFLVTLAVLSMFTQRVVAYLTPPEGDEPFYLMTAISILKDGDLNECNNYARHDEAQIYPSFYYFDGAQAYADFPKDWIGQKAPYPLPPHAGHIVPASRQCSDNYRTYPVDYNNPTGELYSKHGLGMSLLALPAFALGGRLAVVFFLNLLGALLAANIYLLAREGTGKVMPAILTWAAFALTVPLLAYSYLIFPELPAALLIVYAFRRIRLMGNSAWQILLVGLCIATLPWFHYRFAPVSVGLVIYYFVRDRGLRETRRQMKWWLLMAPPVASAVALMLFFYQRYRLPFPNPEDHAGISDVAGTARGIVGLFLDQQWGLFVAAPVFVLAIVGIVLMLQNRVRRGEMGWIAVVALPYFLVIANYAQWWGEWCPPARYLAPILPLLALPFAIVLANIKGIVYKVIYGVLLLLSLLTTWGFLYQPQWSYNQPDGKALLLTKGLAELAHGLYLPFLANLGATNYFPSFVQPYFAYFKSVRQGDAAASAAWRTSIWLFLAIFMLVGLCLVLAHISKQRDQSQTSGDMGSMGGVGGSGSDMDSPDAPREVLPVPVAEPASSFRTLALAWLFGKWRATGRWSRYIVESMARLVSSRPAFAWAGVGAPLVSDRWHFQTETPDSTGQPLAGSPPNGPQVMEPYLPGTHSGNGSGNGLEANGNGAQTGDTLVQAKAAYEPAPGVATEAHKKRKGGWLRAFIGVLWRTRGLWFGLAAVGVAMYAQKLTTVDRQIVPSIRWYAFAIFLMIAGLHGTYKNRSFLMIPVRQARQKKAKVVEAAAVVVAALPVGDAIVSTNGLVAPEDAFPLHANVDLPPMEMPSAPLPARKRSADGGKSYITPVTQVEAAPIKAQEAFVAPLQGRARSSGAITDKLGDWSESSPAVSRGPDTTPLIAEDGMPDGAMNPMVIAPPLEIAATSAPAVVSVAQPGLSRSPVAVWKRFSARFPGFSGAWWRYTLMFVALGLNLYSAGRIRADYFSAVGSWGWLASLALLLLAFFRERKRPLRDLDDHTDIEERTDVRISRKAEFAIIVLIFLLGLGLRLLNLGEWTTGMHGDEGEAGMDAINILEGNRVSPFLTGWFEQPNFYYWGIALTMKVFGTDLFGLRMFSALCGALMLLPFYGLVKMWFGVRTAIIAGLLLAFLDVAIHFSKAEFSNITTPLFLTTGFYFLFRGLQNKRTINFVLSGFAFMLSLYFYMGARLTPILLAAVVGYLFLLMPVVGLPGAFIALRRAAPKPGVLRAIGGAIWGQAQTVLHYFGQILALAIACLCLLSPWLVHYIDNQASLNARTNEKLIFTNEARMVGQYGVTHDPLYLGIRMPTSDDIYPFSPVVFEKTPVSVELSKDGFWTRTLWAQLTTTLSIFTYRFDASSVYTFTNEPVSKPIEAALLILGLAWALWRWRDTRMAVMSMWFWSAVLVGGVLTIDAPYMARMVGIIPVMAIAAALPLSKLSAEFLRLMGIIAGTIKRARPRRIFAVSSRAFSASAIGALLLFLAFQNYGDYFGRYIRSYSFSEVTGQAYFVRHMNDRVKAEGRPLPRYYSAGIHFIYWGHGDNRFLNHGTPGDNMVNPTNDLPVTESENRDVVFMIWPHTMHYLDIIKQYYPEGEGGPFQYGDDGRGPTLFSYWHVTSAQLQARRHTVALYTPATGPAIQREEPGYGRAEGADAPPKGLSYPVQASWSANIVAPSYGRYKFSVDTGGAGSLVIDGTPVLTTTTQAGHAEVELLLARGPHSATLTGALADAAAQVELQWSVNGVEFAPIPRNYVWDGPGRALLGQVSAYVGDLLTPTTEQGPSSIRVDGFLGFRHSPEALLNGSALTAIWKGTLDIKQEGIYGFDVNSNGDSVILVDNIMVVNNIRGGFDPRLGSGQAELSPGPHTFELRYNYTGGTGYLEVFWTPPGGQHVMLGPDVLHTDGGIVDPSQVVTEPPPVQIEADTPAATLQPDGVISGELARPRGVAVDKQGNVYVGDRDNHRIVVFSPDGKVARAWGKALPAAVDGQPPPTISAQGGEFADILDVAVGADGTVYVFDNAPRMQAFTPQGDFKGSVEPGQLNMYGPNGIGAASALDAARTPQGASVMIAVTGQSRVLKLPSFDALKAGQAQPADGENIVISAGDNLEQPVDAVADPTSGDTVYAIDLKDRIMQLKAESKDPNGPRTWTIARQWRVPVGKDEGGSRLAIAPDGKHIYMSDPDRKRVAVLDVDKGKISFFGTEGHDAGQFGAPSGIDVGPDGKVYVLDRINNNIQIFDLSKQK